jgi:hypothetical protein
MRVEPFIVVFGVVVIFAVFIVVFIGVFVVVGVVVVVVVAITEVSSFFDLLRDVVVVVVLLARLLALLTLGCVLVVMWLACISGVGSVGVFAFVVFRLFFNVSKYSY